ncbi:MAG TPA: hypothetical protein VNO86_12240 [Candidatus Binatia bacterium]|nr:hypothetical protein [Candidatus Binatia bacterium]
MRPRSTGRAPRTRVRGSRPLLTVLLVAILTAAGCTQPGGPDASPAASPPASYDYGY